MELKIIEFSKASNKDKLLEQISKSEWNAGQYLHYLLTNNKLQELCGQTTETYLLMDNDNITSFCTLAEKDEVIDLLDKTLWIGFVYTFPQYRGKRLMGNLLEHCIMIAKKRGVNTVFVSTNEIGLYEKYGFTFYKMMKTIDGTDSRVYVHEEK